MKKTFPLVVLAAVAIQTVHAQGVSVTYNHDSPKQNQITVMETGAGALTPELYYTLLHNKYKENGSGQEQTVIQDNSRYRPVWAD